MSVPMMTDVLDNFSVMSVALKRGETRRLLDDVSGFVALGSYQRSYSINRLQRQEGFHR